MSRELLGRLALAAALVVAVTSGASAANKEHQQMMADIRMLQEQTAQLQAHLAALTEALRAISAKLDEQGGGNRKGFADQKLLSDTLSNDLRVVREKVDDNNVRISSLSQELEAIRLAMPQSTPGQSSTPTGEQPTPSAAPTSGQQTPPPTPPPPGVSPQRLYDMAWADYAAAQYNLAISGFENYIRTFGKTEQAGDAQYLHR